jgi:Dolichyl-phosphate-mannose-protein mannosyltransferase
MSALPRRIVTASRQRPNLPLRPGSRAGEPFPLRPSARAELPVAREIPKATAFALVGALTLVGAAIRIATTHGLSVEEISNLDQANRSLGNLLAHVVHRGVAPPLQPVLEWCTVRLLGDGDFAIRFPSLVAGVLLIPVTAWLAGELFDRTTAVVAALFAAVVPILIWYSQEATPYALTALFATLTVLGAVRVVQHGRPADWALYTVAAALAVWSDWSGIFIVAATELVLLLELLHRRRIRAPSHQFLKAWGLGTLALACHLAPLGLLFAFQLHGDGGLAGVTSVSATGVSFNTAVSNLYWAMFGFHASRVTTALAAAWPLAMLTSLLLLGRGVDRRITLLLVCGLIPPLGVLALGLAVPGAFDVRYGLAAVPPFLVLIARMATAWPRGRTARWLVIAAIVALLAGSLADQQIDSRNPRVFDYRQALEQVQNDAGPQAAIFYDPANLQSVFAHFAPGLHASQLTTHLPTRLQAGSVFVVASGANQGAPLELRYREIGALRATRKLVSYHRYPGVQVWWFR